MERSRGKKTPVIHDKGLLDDLLGAARLRNPDVRTGSMFGSPAIFLGRRMIGCVFGSSIGLKVPAAVASTAIAEGFARHFRPYGKPAMREWIEIDGHALTQHADLVEQAIRFAGAKEHDD